MNINYFHKAIQNYERRFVSVTHHPDTTKISDNQQMSILSTKWVLVGYTSPLLTPHKYPKQITHQIPYFSP